jgi:multidrug efflux pump subunit AcrB
MGIVRLALRRPYTFIVMGLLIGVLGILSMLTMSTDIFPDINIPVISVVWTYGGIAPLDMENRVILIAERLITTTVTGIEHMESQSMSGVGVIKIYFHPNADRGSPRRSNRHQPNGFAQSASRGLTRR